MEIVLRNGEKINLDWNPLVYEYLEEYEGGLKQLQKDLDESKHYYLVMNFIVFCLMQVAYNKPIKYREAISLVSPDDYPKIIDFILQNESIVEKKEETKSDNSKIELLNKHRY